MAAPLPVNAADALNVENDYFALMRGYKYFTRPLTRSVVGGLLDPRTTPTQLPQAVDLTTFTKGMIVQHLLDVQKAKLDKRTVPKQNLSVYTTYFRNGSPIEICREEIWYHQQQFFLEIRYNGNLQTSQVGNCLLTSPNNPTLTYAHNAAPLPVHLANAEVNLLLLTEIMRRKAVDPHRAHLPDQFFNVPVAVGIAMAHRLATDGHMDYNLFWRSTNTHRYHMFSGYDRLEAFRRLAHLYHQRYANEMQTGAVAHYQWLMEWYYGPVPPTIENEGIVLTDVL